MPKIIELTVELEVQKVSCPGVWLCQDGRVSLTVFLLGTSYQTCMLPPVFPLMFKDVFYFRKRFQESCALNNICCILKDETIYCELVQWSDNCYTGDCSLLAQYLGALNDVLFPPNMCSTDGVDLLMRRAKEFPGILSPKIEIATKVRIDEVWDQPCNIKALRVTSCHCTQDDDGARQKQVCHSAQYHRHKCTKSPSVTGSRSRSRSRSQGSTRSCCSLTPEPAKVVCECAKYTKSAKSPAGPGSRSRSRSRTGPLEDSTRSYCSFSPKSSRVTCECTKRPSSSSKKSRTSLCQNRNSRRRCEYNVYNVETVVTGNGKRPSSDASSDISEMEEYARSQAESEKVRMRPLIEEDRMQKSLLESRYIDQEPIYQSKLKEREIKKHFQTKLSPCVCEICKKYHELFHTNESRS